MSNEHPSFEPGPATGPAPSPAAGRVWRGTTEGAGLRLALVASRFNERLTGQLIEGARGAAASLGVAADAVDLARVPGAYEIPLIADRLAASGRYDAIVALGCVIEGETPHAQLITEAVTPALTGIGVRHRLPVIDCIVATRTEAQAEARCRPGPDGRGWYAVCAAVEMATLLNALEAGAGS